MIRRPRVATLALALVASAGAYSAAEDAARPSDGRTSDQSAPDPEVFEQAWRAVRDQFYDRRFAGVDWEGARARWLPKAKAATNRRELHEVILAMLAELKTSHLTLNEADVQKEHVETEMKNKLASSFGLELARLDQGYFVSDVTAGGAAAAAGIVRGDRLLKVDGASCEEADLRPGSWDPGVAGSPRVYYLAAATAVAPATTASVTLELERRRTAQAAGYNVYTTKLVPRPWNEVEGMRAAARTFEASGGVTVAYARVYHLLGEDVTDVLGDVLAHDPIASADGLVLDIRGRGGLASVAERFLSLFDRHGATGPAWTKPVVALIDGETRSAKEILAWNWREAGIGPLVGERTRGAVTGSRFLALRDGATLQIAISDMRALTGGNSLEKRGVEPDVPVKDELPYVQGRDPILERGVATLRDEVLARRRGARPHGWY